MVLIIKVYSKSLFETNLGNSKKDKYTFAPPNLCIIFSTLFGAPGRDRTKLSLSRAKVSYFYPLKLYTCTRPSQKKAMALPVLSLRHMSRTAIIFYGLGLAHACNLKKNKLH